MSSSTQLQTLNDKFNNILSEYQNTYQEYLKTIKSNGSSSAYSDKLQHLNAQLLALNNEISNNVSGSYSGYQQQQDKVQQQHKTMQHNYHVLEQERDQLNQMGRQFRSLDGAMDDGELNVTMYYYNYIILTFIVIILVMLLIKYSVVGLTQRGGGNMFMHEAMLALGIIVAFVVLTTVFKTMNVFIFVAIIVIAYLIAKLKLMSF